MFSYRHAFHAGNHADVLKHVALVAILRQLIEKETALTVVDTHAGAGLYRLDGRFAETSEEALDGIQKIFASPATPKGGDALDDYRSLIESFNAKGQQTIYPGSPLLMHRLLRAQDRLRLHEMHPTDIKLLSGHVEQLHAGRQVTVFRTDGFTGLKAVLPPPSRRALVLIDPSYEIKSDYPKVAECLEDALKRFPTGVYAVWYPVIPRPEAHSLPRRLRTMANQAKRNWLHLTLAVGRAEGSEPHGLSASGLFVFNPPFQLRERMQVALPRIKGLLQRGTGAAFHIEAG